MKWNKTLTFTFLMLMIVAAFYRLTGFAPHLAMALFAGAVIKDKKWAFTLPLLSIFVADPINQLLYTEGLSPLPGFYAGQITNYLLFGGLVVIGFFVTKINVVNVLLFSLTICSTYFILSNFFVWINGAGWARPKNFAGLMLCYEDGLPFFRTSIFATLAFSAVLFGSYYIITSKRTASKVASK